nr:hypothetical protein [Francisella hispaniensis]
MRPQVPLIIAIDYEGKVNRLKAKYGFPETFTAKIFRARYTRTDSCG